MSQFVNNLSQLYNISKPDCGKHLYGVLCGDGSADNSVETHARCGYIMQMTPLLSGVGTKLN